MARVEQREDAAVRRDGRTPLPMLTSSFPRSEYLESLATPWRDPTLFKDEVGNRW